MPHETPNRLEEHALDGHRMLKDIANLVQNDFCADMELKAGFNREFTQEDAREMAKIITKVYSIAHQVTCTAHNEYRILQVDTN